MDFSILTNDQLVELIRAACAEAGSRGNAVEAAARAAMLSEAEKVQIAREAAEREAEKLRQAEAARIARDAAEQVRRQSTQEQETSAQDKQRRQWGMQKTLAEMARRLFGAGITLTVWNKDGDKRVYLDREVSASRRSSSSQVRVEYYLTGNRYNPPGTLKISGSDVAGTDEEKALALILVQKAAKEWNSLGKMDCDQAASAQVPAVGDVPAEFAAYGAVRAAAEAAEKAEETRRAEEARQQKAREDAEKAERLAREKVERQEKLRALLGGVPIWAKNWMPVAEEKDLEGSANTRDNGLRTVVAVRTEQGALRVVTVQVRQNKIALEAALSESARYEDLPQRLTRLLDDADRALLSAPDGAEEMDRDALAGPPVGYYSNSPALEPTEAFMTSGFYSVHLQCLTGSGLRPYDQATILPLFSPVLREKTGWSPAQKVVTA